VLAAADKNQKKTSTEFVCPPPEGNIITGRRFDAKPQPVCQDTDANVGFLDTKENII